jgi:hypothetical protein
VTVSPPVALAACFDFAGLGARAPGVRGFASAPADAEVARVGRLMPVPAGRARNGSERPAMDGLERRRRRDAEAGRARAMESEIASYSSRYDRSRQAWREGRKENVDQIVGWKETNALYLLGSVELLLSHDLNDALALLADSLSYTFWLLLAVNYAAASGASLAVLCARRRTRGLPTT